MCLNNDRLVAAATLARSLLELTVNYGDAANRLRHEFDHIPWELIRTHVLQLDRTDEKGRRVGQESYVERLMSGTRLRLGLEVNQDMEQKNILSVIDSTDKKLAQQGFGYTIKPHYELLCELAHPNCVGYNRFLTSVTPIENGWTARLMEEKADSKGTVYISGECLWALSFSTGSLNGLFSEFQKLMRSLGQRLGRILPDERGTR